MAKATQPAAERSSVSIPPAPADSPADSLPPSRVASVDLNNRYAAACKEITTRIGQRQNTLVLFVSLIFGIGAALTASRENFDTSPLMFAIPVASLVCAALYLVHDLMIRNLIKFCRECESIDAASSLPKYYSDPAYRAAAKKARLLGSLTVSILIGGANIVAVPLAITHFPDLIHLNSLAAVASAFAIAAALVMVILPIFTRE